ncbi:MAG: TetR/AcrR family transcriptional regulator [Clostridia bacterium]|nr:TetR/AcrR family transcriptional regulator [Clostridia bacterium]
MKLDHRAKLTTGQKRTTNMIVSAFFLLLSKKNFDNVSVQEICRMSLIPRSTFYNYFDDKYDVVRWAFWRTIHELYPDLYKKMNHYDNIDYDAEAIYGFIEKNKSIFRKIAVQNPMFGTLHQLFRECFCEFGEIIAQNCTSGKEYEYPYEVVFNTYVDGLMAIFNQAFWSKKDYTLEQLRNYMHEIYYN